MNFRYLIAMLPLALAAFVSACGGGVTSGDAPTASSAPTPSLAEQIQRLEDSGQLPTLDRSEGLRGPDADNNGIRDDVDAWIALLPVTDIQKKAAQQSARVRQAEILVDLADNAELDRLGDRSMASVVCLGDVFMPQRQQGRNLGSQIESITANTRERAKKYFAYNRAVSGSSGRLPDGNTCEP